MPAVVGGNPPPPAVVQPHDLPLPTDAGLSSSTPVGGGTPAGSDYTSALKQATAQALADISSQVAPLQGQVSGLQAAQGQAAGTIQDEFNSILPSVQTSAQQVQDFNNRAQADQQAVFTAAGQQLNTIQQNNAAEAQRQAQASGGPVSTGVFTGQIEPFQTAEAESGAVGQLTGLELGVAGSNAAQDFAGKVFPAMEAEQLGTSRQDFQNKINDLETQISAVQGTKSKLINAALPGLVNAQRTYELDKAKLALQNRTEADRNRVTLRALHQKDQELALATGKEIFNEGATTKRLQLSQGQLDLATQRLTAQEKQAAARIGISEQEYALRAHQYDVTNAIAKKRLQVQQESNMRSIIDAALGGSNSSKPTTVKIKQVLDPTSPQVVAAQTNLTHPPSNVYHDPKTGQWYTYVSKSMTPAQFAQATGMSGTPTTNPQELYNMLSTYAKQSGNWSKSTQTMIVGIINTRLGLNSWHPGKQTSFTSDELGKMSDSQLRSTADGLGFQAGKQPVTKGRLVNFILHASK